METIFIILNIGMLYFLFQDLLLIKNMGKAIVTFANNVHANNFVNERCLYVPLTLYICVCVYTWVGKPKFCFHDVAFLF